MAFDADSLGLQPAGLSLLRDLVHERTGLYYAPSRFDHLVDRLASLVAERGFASFLDYFYYLKYDASAAVEWDRVMDALSVPETYFWREVDQIEAIVERVIPALARRASTAPIRIWSAPCASGEEPLTIAMVLDAGNWFERAHIEIHAGDASQAALARAEKRLYRERSFRVLPENLRARYFRRCGDAWQVDSALYARVSSWRRINLMQQSDIDDIAQSDIVFCRNVFIYFSDDGVRRVVNTMADRMPVPGYLCVGASESLIRVTDRLELEELGNAFVYTKRSATPGNPR